MIEHMTTTPFGRRQLSAAMIAGQKAARSVAADASADKWHIFRAVCEARDRIGASDRSLAVLGALLSFHPQGDLAAGEKLVVFPSNAQLALRAHGMAPATLRRHLAVLVDCGLVVRRDSPNGKRYARRGQGGEIEQAFGFDLTPLLARAAEFERLAEEVQAERLALRLLRERLTLLRRDIVKMIAFGAEEGVCGDWHAFQAEYRAIIGRLPRTPDPVMMAEAETGLLRLAALLRKLLETHADSTDSSANESQNERHIQNSKPDSHEFEPRSEKEQGARAAPELETKSAPPSYPLGLVLRACPDIAEYAPDGIRDWRDFVATTAQVRGYLGVSPSAYADALDVLGQEDTAIVIACILQRMQEIQSAGGYLRALTEKARAGAFSVGPMLMAALKTNAPAGRKAG
ncbi:replication initiation protein RepC [Aquamicrobium terrae]